MHDIVGLLQIAGICNESTQRKHCQGEQPVKHGNREKPSFDGSLTHERSTTHMHVDAHERLSRHIGSIMTTQQHTNSQQTDSKRVPTCVAVENWYSCQLGAGVKS